LTITSILFVVAALQLAHPAVAAEDAESSALEKTYATAIRPLVAKYCQECHGTKQAEAEINLTSFVTLADVRQHPRTWIKVREMLESGQMPPEEAKQLADAERTQLKKWVRDYLTLEARARAGDPGRVVLRRLSNAEYTCTIRDLARVAGLDPAREFPVDGAAGEGFTNAGNALVMSPALITKYLDAAKEIASHAVLLPDGFRFSPYTTRRDWTDDTLKQIRDVYREFTDPAGGTRVNLQGIISETNTGGRLPLEKYLAATIVERERLTAGATTIARAAQEHGLNAKYLGMLWRSLNGTEPSLVLDGIRARWRTAKPEDVAALVAYVAAWQKELWKFSTVGHIGKVGGPKAWMEPVSPMMTRQEVRFKIPVAPDASEVTLALVASDAGDGNDHDFVIWEKPRLVAPGRPDLLLRDVREVTRELTARRTRIFARAAAYLNASEEAAAEQGNADIPALARKHDVDTDMLRAWLDYLGIGGGGPIKVEGHFTTKIGKSSGYDFINGWGTDATPLLLANSSDRHVRVPGNMKPHSVAVHPSPTLRAAVGFQSPVTATMRLEAKVTHAHPECGNGVTWALELRRGATRQRLATGTAQGSAEVKAGPFDNVALQAGDLVSLLIGPRDGNHSCDLTAIDLKLTETGENGRTWNLADDVSADVQMGNPHADRFGHTDVWHFYTESDKGGGSFAPVIPAGSILTKWQMAKGAQDRQQLAVEVQKLLTAGAPAAKESPDAALYRQLASFGGPLLGAGSVGRSGSPADSAPGVAASDLGPDPALFGKHPDGRSIDPASLCVRAPAVIEMRLPADRVAGCEFVATCYLDPQTGAEGSVQLQVLPHKPARDSGLILSDTKVTVANGQWSADNRRVSFGTPILTAENSAARKRIEGAFAEFRDLFPAALCYSKIVPIDEVVTLTLYYREDHHLVRLMLDDAQRKRLDRLWDELHYVSQDSLTLVDALAQLLEYATQDADPKVFEPLRKPFAERAAAFRQSLVDSEPQQLAVLLDFAAQAFRRPLTREESADLRGLYARLREQEIPHDAAFRLTLARILVAPAFLYRMEAPQPGAKATPVTDWELASRLSYFLWSSPPDDELRQAAAAGKLHHDETLLSQTRRMLHDPRSRNLATEFACQWLHIYDFDRLDEKSERHFPSFAGLRGAMYEESIQFFTHLFQDNGSVLDILDADYTFVNDELAQMYGLPAVPGSGPSKPADKAVAASAWRRVDGVKQFGRGGILGQATTLAKQSGASRTSPILRGNWISEVLLGERLPRPPKDVPRLPEDETETAGLTVRQLVEKHSSDPKCAVCHQRIDAFGFSLERYDAIGRHRDKDLADRPIETRVKTMDGAEFDGLDGLRRYLLTVRREAFLRQFCRKLLGYSLGRGVQLSDEPLLAEMQSQLQSHDFRIAAAVETIVRSPQFREIRGRDTAFDE
jgi:mono/diheme cytochrome c family protein